MFKRAISLLLSVSVFVVAIASSLPQAVQAAPRVETVSAVAHPAAPIGQTRVSLFLPMVRSSAVPTLQMHYLANAQISAILPAEWLPRVDRAYTYGDGKHFLSATTLFTDTTDLTNACRNLSANTSVNNLSLEHANDATRPYCTIQPYNTTEVTLLMSYARPFTTVYGTARFVQVQTDGPSLKQVLPGITVQPEDVTPSQYLDGMLDVLQVRWLYSYRVAWDSFRKQAQTRLAQLTQDKPWQSGVRNAAEALQASAQTIGDVSAAITELTTSEQGVSSLQPVELPEGRILDGKIGYLSLPAAPLNWNDQRDYAAAGHALIRKLDEQNGAPLQSWIIDLRTTSGEIETPLLVALSPLLGRGNAGGHYYARYNALPTQPFTPSCNHGTDLLNPASVTYFEFGTVPALLEAPYMRGEQAPTIAVLVGSDTTAAGERLTAALRGRANVRIFGSETAGQLMEPEWITLPDNTLVHVARGYFMDWIGASHTAPITPDVVTSASSASTTDAPLQAAREWLSENLSLSH